MATRSKLTVRWKIFLTLTVATLTLVSAYLGITLNVFYRDRARTLHELNRQTVKSFSGEIQAQISGLAAKLKTMTLSVGKSSEHRDLFLNEGLLISVDFFSATRRPGVWRNVNRLQKYDYLKRYQQDPSQVEAFRRDHPIPFSTILNETIWIRSGTLPGGAPLLTLAVATANGTRSDVPVIAVAEIRLDYWLGRLRDLKNPQVFIVDREGKVIAHSDFPLVENRSSLEHHPVVERAIDNVLTERWLKFDWMNETWLGAFAFIEQGELIVVAQTPYARLEGFPLSLMRKSILFVLLAITVFFMASRWIANRF